jgi:hypothetical protein
MPTVSSQGAASDERSRRILIGMIVAFVGVIAIAYIGFGLSVASTTLGCDYSTYADAATRHLNGEALYPAGVARTGECGLYQYPPPFLLFVLPFVALGAAGLWVWIAASTTAFAVACAILPVRPWIRIAIFLLGAMGWPLIFGLRIGQVVPFLFLLSALGWRWLDRPGPLGLVVGIGTIVKVQPGLVIAWLVLRLNLRAAAAAIATIAVIGVAGLVVGLGDLPTFLRVLGQISSATDLPSNYAIGASAHRLGLDLPSAGILQAVNTVAMLGLVVVAARWMPKVPGYLLVVTISQIVSPIVWTHYALALLLPVAWLLERRQWWILIVPLSHLWLLIAIVPEQVYTVPYYVVIAALFVVGWRERTAIAAGAGSRPGPIAAAPRAEPA